MDDDSPQIKKPVFKKKLKQAKDKTRKRLDWDDASASTNEIPSETVANLDPSIDSPEAPKSESRYLKYRKLEVSNDQQNSLNAGTSDLPLYKVIDTSVPASGRTFELKQLFFRDVPMDNLTLENEYGDEDEPVDKPTVDIDDDELIADNIDKIAEAAPNSDFEMEVQSLSEEEIEDSRKRPQVSLVQAMLERLKERSINYDMARNQRQDNLRALQEKASQLEDQRRKLVALVEALIV